MRPEKKFLVEEIAERLKGTDYVFLTSFHRLTVKETAELRSRLAPQKAEFHVIKSSILNQAAKSLNLPDYKPILAGQIAMVSGGANPSEVAKILLKFNKDKDKVEMRGGSLGDRMMTVDEIESLSKLPGLEVLRAQLLGLLNTPAQRMVSVLNAVPQSVVTVLKAYADSKGEAA